MKHTATSRFWKCFEKLPEYVKGRAKNNLLY